MLSLHRAGRGSTSIVSSRSFLSCGVDGALQLHQVAKDAVAYVPQESLTTSTLNLEDPLLTLDVCQFTSSIQLCAVGGEDTARSVYLYSTSTTNANGAKQDDVNTFGFEKRCLLTRLNSNVTKLSFAKFNHYLYLAIGGETVSEISLLRFSLDKLQGDEDTNPLTSPLFESKNWELIQLGLPTSQTPTNEVKCDVTDIIFPNECEVLAATNVGVTQWVLPKNGDTSMEKTTTKVIGTTLFTGAKLALFNHDNQPQYGIASFDRNASKIEFFLASTDVEKSPLPTALRTLNVKESLMKNFPELQFRKESITVQGMNIIALPIVDGEPQKKSLLSVLARGKSATDNSDKLINVMYPFSCVTTSEKKQTRLFIGSPLMDLSNVQASPTDINAISTNALVMDEGKTLVMAQYIGGYVSFFTSEMETLGLGTESSNGSGSHVITSDGEYEKFDYLMNVYDDIDELGDVSVEALDKMSNIQPAKTVVSDAPATITTADEKKQDEMKTNGEDMSEEEDDTLLVNRNAKRKKKRMTLTNDDDDDEEENEQGEDKFGKQQESNEVVVSASESTKDLTETSEQKGNENDELELENLLDEDDLKVLEAHDSEKTTEATTTDDLGDSGVSVEALKQSLLGSPDGKQGNSGGSSVVLKDGTARLLQGNGSIHVDDIETIRGVVQDTLNAIVQPQAPETTSTTVFSQTVLPQAMASAAQEMLLQSAFQPASSDAKTTVDQSDSFTLQKLDSAATMDESIDWDEATQTGKKLLCWNFTGSIVSYYRKIGGLSSMHVKFSERNRRDVKIDQSSGMEYTLASLSETGVFLASKPMILEKESISGGGAVAGAQGDNSRVLRATMLYKPFDPYNNFSGGGGVQWEQELPVGETPVAIACGNGWCAVATSSKLFGHLLRCFRASGLQESPVCLPGPVVAMAACNATHGMQQLAVVCHGEGPVLGEQRMTLQLYALGSAFVASRRADNGTFECINDQGEEERKVVLPAPMLADTELIYECKLPLSGNVDLRKQMNTKNGGPTKLEWLGFSSEGLLVTVDSLGLVQGLRLGGGPCGAMGALAAANGSVVGAQSSYNALQRKPRWVPLLHFDQYRNKGNNDHYFVVGVRRGKVLAALLKHGKRTPKVNPLPVLTGYPMTLCLLPPSSSCVGFFDSWEGTLRKNREKEDKMLDGSTSAKKDSHSHTSAMGKAMEYFPDASTDSSLEAHALLRGLFLGHHSALIHHFGMPTGLSAVEQKINQDTLSLDFQEDSASGESMKAKRKKRRMKLQRRGTVLSKNYGEDEDWNNIVHHGVRSLQQEMYDYDMTCGKLVQKILSSSKGTATSTDAAALHMAMRLLGEDAIEKATRAAMHYRVR
eukprot:g3256.t1